MMLGAVAALATDLAARWRQQPATQSPVVRDSAMEVLSAGAETNGFARAEQAHVFDFPRDHGAHPDFRCEWWYFTGHLLDAEQQPFGFQLTLFRFALAPRAPPSSSTWRTPTVLLGHFAISDIAAQRFHAFERMSRAVPAIAGTSLAPATVWLDDWRLEQRGADGWHLYAAQDDIALDLALESRSAVVLQGDRGLSRKSAAAGDASYYYSVPRLHAEGELTLRKATRRVEGEAWLDREWSTSALLREQIGWDWFALQLADGASLMFYRLRRRDGSSSDYSAGTYVDAHQAQHALKAGDVHLESHGSWHNPQGGPVYPQGWRLTVPSAGLELTLTPRLADQEWRGRFRYWEGAVTVAQAHQPAGLGYVELTGY